MASDLSEMNQLTNIEIEKKYNEELYSVTQKLNILTEKNKEHNKKLQNMEDKLNTYANDIKEIKENTILLAEILKNINKSCSNMDSHISFVGKVYNKVREPLNYIKSAYQYYASIEQDNSDLPALT
jgi:archaellum component FlaC